MKSVEISLGSDYTRIQYPAGELQVRLSPETSTALANADEVVILARIKTGQQIIELCLLVDAINSVAPAAITRKLVLPYLPYARADRRFVSGDCFGLAVFAKLLRTLNAEVLTLDAHSAQANELLPGLVDVSALPLISEAIERFAGKHSSRTLTVLFPDEGARKRYHLPEKINGVNVRVLHCSKKRHPTTGKLEGFAVPPIEEFPRTDARPDPVLIVDDICDGGGTFNGIADSLAPHNLVLGLYVTHGIFSKGMNQLESRFSVIYTSDSFEPWSPKGKLEVISIDNKVLNILTFSKNAFAESTQ